MGGAVGGSATGGTTSDVVAVGDGVGLLGVWLAVSLGVVSTGCVAVSLISAGAIGDVLLLVPGDRQPERRRDDDREQPDREQ